MLLLNCASVRKFCKYYGIGEALLGRLILEAGAVKAIGTDIVALRTISSLQVFWRRSFIGPA